MKLNLSRIIREITLGDFLSVEEGINHEPEILSGGSINVL